MTKYFHQILAACALLGASLAFVGCEKDNSKPTGTVGNITGKVAPAAAVTLVTARDSSGGETFTVTPSVATGEFTFFDLKPRTYSVYFTTVNGYAAPTRRSAKVTAGETTDLGIISVVSNIVGSIKGIIAPLGAVTKVTATGSRTVIANPSPTTGQFIFTGLPPGNYSLTFTTATRYVVPAPRVVAVVVADTADLDTIRVILNEGSLTGRVTPLGSTSRVTATDSLNRDVTTIVDPATGRFSFTGLRPSLYRISCTPAAGFIPPQVRRQRVSAGATVDVGSFTVLPAGNQSLGGTFTYKVRDNATGTLTLKTATNVKATRSGGFLIITGSVGASETVSLALNNVTGPGGVPLFGSGAVSYGSYQRGNAIWSTTTLLPLPYPARGQCSITAFSVSTRKVSGGFTFTPAVAANGVAAGSGDQTITNGTFTDVSF